MARCINEDDAEITTIDFDSLKTISSEHHLL